MRLWFARLLKSPLSSFCCCGLPCCSLFHQAAAVLHPPLERRLQRRRPGQLRVFVCVGMCVCVCVCLHLSVCVHMCVSVLLSLPFFVFLSFVLIFYLFCACHRLSSRATWPASPPPGLHHLHWPTSPPLAYITSIGLHHLHLLPSHIHLRAYLGRLHHSHVRGRHRRHAALPLSLHAHVQDTPEACLVVLFSQLRTQLHDDARCRAWHRCC